MKSNMKTHKIRIIAEMKINVPSRIPLSEIIDTIERDIKMVYGNVEEFEITSWEEKDE